MSLIAVDGTRLRARLLMKLLKTRIAHIDGRVYPDKKYQAIKDYIRQHPSTVAHLRNRGLQEEQMIKTLASTL